MSELQEKENMVATINQQQHSDELRKQATRIKVNKHRKSVAQAENLIRKWAWWDKHNNEPLAKPRNPGASEQGHDDDQKHIVTRGKSDPQRLDPRFESYLAVEAYAAHIAPWNGQRRFLRNNSGKAYRIVLLGLYADSERKEWYRGFVLGLARAVYDGDDVLKVKE